MHVIETDRDLADFARALALEEAALVADHMAEQNKSKAADLHRRSSRQAALPGGEDRAEQMKISAQVLDECAAECRAVAAAIRSRITPHGQERPAKGPKGHEHE